MAQMTAQEAAEWGKTLSFEKVWALLAKLGEDGIESNKRLDRLEKFVDEVCKRVDRVSSDLGKLGLTMGELVETLIAARLWEQFPQYDLHRAYQRVPLYDENHIIKTDIDILLVNSILCMAVEVKNKLVKKDDVDHHLRRLGLIRKYPPELVAGKQLLGAMAGGLVDPDVKDYAYANGLYVLELSGESVHLIPPPAGFAPLQW